MRVKGLLILGMLALVGCLSPAYHKKNVFDKTPAENLTVGKVQREIRIGMTSADVVQVLGSPNIVTTDEERREVWVYDKVSSNVSYSKSEGYATLILIGTDRDSGAKSTSQRTLTIVIKFDNDGKVRDFAYHNSQF